MEFMSRLFHLTGPIWATYGHYLCIHLTYAYYAHCAIRLMQTLFQYSRLQSALYLILYQQQKRCDHKREHTMKYNCHINLQILGEDCCCKAVAPLECSTIKKITAPCFTSNHAPAYSPAVMHLNANHQRQANLLFLLLKSTILCLSAAAGGRENRNCM